MAPISRLSIATVIGLAVAPVMAHDGGRHVLGEIYRSDWPLCETFVIEGPTGYSVAQYLDGIWVFVTGDEVFGHFDRMGAQAIVSRGRVTFGAMMVDVRLITQDPTEAETLFRTMCLPRLATPVS